MRLFKSFINIIYIIAPLFFEGPKMHTKRGQETNWDTKDDLYYRNKAMLTTFPNLGQNPEVGVATCRDELVQLGTTPQN